VKLSSSDGTRLAFILAASAFLTSCAGRLERPAMPAVIAVPSPDRQTGNYTLDNYKTDLSAYDRAVGPDAVRIRNKIVYNITAEIDYAFYDYETKLFLNEGKFHIASDFMQLGLAAGSTVSLGARGKTILGALLTGITGLNLSIDKNVFRQQTVQAISSSMEANRDRIKTTIVKQLANDTTAYPMAAARADLIRYFFAGTLSSGLQQLGQTAAADAKTQSAALSDAQVATFSESDVTTATELRQAVGKELAGGDFSELIAWLKAMKEPIADNAAQADVDKACRALLERTVHDATLREQSFAEARKIGLIK